VNDSVPGERYWCDEDSETFAKEYFARVAQTSGANFGDLGALQLRAHLHYYGALPNGYLGDLPSSAIPSRSGEQGSNVELRVNWLRSHANAKHQIIVAPRLTWGTQAVNTDSRSLADAARGGTILEALWKEGPYEQQAIDAVLGGVVDGEEFLFTYWSPTAGEPVDYDEESGQVHYTGDLTCHNVASWNVRRDSTARCFEESDWLSALLLMSRWDLVAQYPEFKDEILKAPSPPASGRPDGNGGITTVNNADKVVCHYFFHKRTPALPTGLQAVLLSNDCVMAFEPLERCYWKLPIHRYAIADLKGTPWAYTDFWEAMALQDLATDIQSSLATNIVAFGKQMISAEADQNLDFDRIGNGPVVLYRAKGTTPPTPLQLTAQPQSAFEHLGALRGDQRQILGLNDVAMGEAPTGTPNAQAWALLSLASTTANSDAQRRYVKFVRNVGASMLNIFKAKASYPRKTAVVGVHGASVPKQEEWDKSDFEGIDDVMIEAANPLQQTAAGRLQIAQMNIDRGFVQTPEQLDMVVRTGQLDPLTQVLRDELIFIAWENEEILKGTNPPVKITDAHQLHIREHRGPTFSADARMTPEINVAADAHIQAHLDMLLGTDPRVLGVLGQAVPQAPMPPGGAPGGPEGGDAAAALESPIAPEDAQNGVTLPTAPVTPPTGDVSAPPGIQ